MIYLIGKHSKRFRKWYYKKYDSWRWGIIQYAVDGLWEDYNMKVSYVYDDDVEEMTQKDLDEFLKVVCS